MIAVRVMRDDSFDSPTPRWPFLGKMNVSRRVPLRATGDWRLPPTTGRWCKPDDFTYCSYCGEPGFVGGECSACGRNIKQKD